MSTSAVEQQRSPKAKTQPERLGAKASTKQMVAATAHGSKIIFPGLGVEGYLVGMDDFHWVVANVTHDLPADSYDVEVVLIHKSAPLVRISRKRNLSNEAEQVQEQVNEIGAGFFAFCRRQPDSSPV